jgi:M6 family metalloprotease-like protein
MKKALQLIIALFLISNSLLYTIDVKAVPAYPHPIEFTQPDGSVITIQLKGDEKVKWAETLDGYTILVNSNGEYQYAIIDASGNLTFSGILVSNINSRTFKETSLLSTIEKGLFFSKSQVQMMKEVWEIRENNSQKAFPTTGDRKLICILIGFQDIAFTKTQAEFNALFNQVGYTVGGATGSVKDYYLENSYNQLNLTVDVAGPYTASQNQAYYGANDASGYDIRPRELVIEAINLADPDVNYAEYDNDGDGWVDGVYIIYAGHGEEAGGGANAIWAHAWSLSSPLLKDGVYLQRYSCSAELRGGSGTNLTRIGVICHEFGHVLGAPDYYDTNYGTGGQFEGTGQWDMMAGGSWNNGGATPAHHNGFTKVVFYNWASATVLSTPSTITLNNAAENSNSFYRYNTATSGEYFLVENREKHKFDYYIPGSGMIIYHVHSGVMTAAGSNSINNTHPQRMYPVAQNATMDPTSSPSSYGNINHATCAWTGTSGKTAFTDATLPSSKSWAGANTAKPITNILRNGTAKTVTFDFMGGGNLPVVTTNAITLITATTARSGGSVTSDGGSTVTLRGIAYATTQNPTTANSTVPSGIGTGNFVSDMTGLAHATTYYVRAFATNANGTSYGEQFSFTTLSSPTVSTNNITGITATSATGGGNVTADGGASVTQRGIAYATTQNPTTSNTVVYSGTGTGSYTSNMAGLNPETTYYVRAFATNTYGTSYGTQKSFTTSAATTTPTVTTTEVTNIAATTANTGGNVTSDGGASVTSRGVVYATTQNPTTANNSVSGGSGTGSFNVTLSSLSPNTTYYVRAFAVNSQGTAYGTQRSFTTAEDNTSITDVDAITKNMLVFPNPAYDIVSIASSNNLKSVRVFDVFGNMIYIASLDETSNKYQININEFAAGIYFIQISNKEGVFTSKLQILK